MVSLEGFWHRINCMLGASFKLFHQKDFKLLIKKTVQKYVLVKFISLMFFSF